MEKMELLEEKIRRAADTIRALREERIGLEDQLKHARDEVRRLSARREDPDRDGRIEKLTRERQVVAERIEQMLSIINEVEAS